MRLIRLARRAHGPAWESAKDGIVKWAQLPDPEGNALPFEQEAGEIYWISIQAVHLFFTGSQWGWTECLSDHYWNDEAVMVFPELGIPDWTPMTLATGEYAELAFVLYGQAFSPVESKTWSTVKAMFR